MIIFPITEEAHSVAPVLAWTAIEERLKQTAAEYWLVTQPSHAALAGDLAAALRENLFGAIDQTVARCIALHDAGWSMDDAEQIQRLRSQSKQKPSSFLDASTDSFLQAWTGSIETAAKFAPIGGYLVSRHFERLSLWADEKSAAKVEAFRKREKERQQKLKKSLNRDDTALERLVDALQFCDVLSLYLCCGSSRTVKFEKPAITLSRKGDEYRLDPSPFREAKQFSFSALRHPVSSGKKGQSGATFYINL
ncbi:MAG TPA: DUF3891 family protein [Terriglobales bacterium]|jgi:hypothetical protein|nr:DUF3891 family protein [Terriglobales bacterium]